MDGQYDSKIPRWVRAKYEMDGEEDKNSESEVYWLKQRWKILSMMHEWRIPI